MNQFPWGGSRYDHINRNSLYCNVFITNQPCQTGLPTFWIGDNVHCCRNKGVATVIAGIETCAVAFCAYHYWQLFSDVEVSTRLYQSKYTYDISWTNHRVSNKPISYHVTLVISCDKSCVVNGNRPNRPWVARGRLQSAQLWLITVWKLRCK
jgi:hypothetical protein